MTIALTGGIALSGCTGRGQPEYAFAELVYPGATSTAAAGVNAAGDVVGWYVQKDRTYGYLYRSGTYTSFAYPGAAVTQLTGIAENGEIVGSYRRPDEVPPPGTPAIAYHGFLRLVSGELREVRHPDHKYTVAQRLLPDGTVLGCFHDDDFTTTMRGIRIRREAIVPDAIPASAFEVVERPASMHNGATPDGSRIVGFVMDTHEAYTLDRGIVTTFTAPGATRTEAWDINPAGVIAGTFVDSASRSHGFVLENGRFTTLDVPGAVNTVAFGINSRRQVVGAFEGADGQRRGYIASTK